jgi:hypothetical protein
MATETIVKSLETRKMPTMAITKQHPTLPAADGPARPVSAQAWPTSRTVTPLMGPADPGTVTPLMGPADPGTVTPLMGPADPGTVTPLMGPADPSVTPSVSSRR